MDRFFILLQRIVPHHGLSRLVGLLAKSNTQWLKNICIRLFINIYKVDMRESARKTPAEFSTFNDFFTRELRPGARTIRGSITCPADGKVSAVGRIERNQIFQAKGLTYSLQKLLATERVGTFIDGSFITIYLAPSNYHRVHFPVTNDLRSATYVPGRLFSVNQVTAANVPDLFADNERLVCNLSTAAGSAAIIMVGAMIVAGIKSAWNDDPYEAGCLKSETFDDPQHYEMGTELGQFYLGSTAIILLPGKVDWKVQAADIVRFGDALV
jgi:phosphatidylserine decarboxylase